MLIVGDQEMENQQVSLRLRSGENPGAQSLDAFLSKANQDIAAKI